MAAILIIKTTYRDNCILSRGQQKTQHGLMNTKTKCMVINKESRKCKLSIECRGIEQVSAFNYLRDEIASKIFKCRSNKTSNESRQSKKPYGKNIIITESNVKIYETGVRSTLP